MTLGQGAVLPFVFPFKLSQLQSEGIQRRVNNNPNPHSLKAPRTPRAGRRMTDSTSPARDQSVWTALEAAILKPKSLSRSCD